MPPTVLAGEVLRAAAAGDAREVKKLLKRNAPVVFPALIAGVQGGHADVVALLAASPDINVNACLANGCSPLFTSAAKGDDAVVRGEDTFDLDEDTFVLDQGTFVLGHDTFVFGADTVVFIWRKQIWAGPRHIFVWPRH